MNNRHLTMAESYLRSAEDAHSPDSQSAFNALAQSGALLALAYEQRTANLLAAYTYGIVGPSNESVDESTIITRLGLGDTK